MSQTLARLFFKYIPHSYIILFYLIYHISLVNPIYLLFRLIPKPRIQQNHLTTSLNLTLQPQPTVSSLPHNRHTPSHSPSQLQSEEKQKLESECVFDRGWMRRANCRLLNATKPATKQHWQWGNLFLGIVWRKSLLNNFPRISYPLTLEYGVFCQYFKLLVVGQVCSV